MMRMHEERVSVFISEELLTAMWQLTAGGETEQPSQWPPACKEINERVLGNVNA